MVRLKSLFAIALAALFLAGTSAKAVPMPVDPETVEWEYVWANNVGNSIPSDPDGNGISTGNVNFVPTGTWNPITGSSDIVAANLYTVSTANAKAPSKLDVNGDYTLSLTIRLKNNPSVSDTVTFSGKLGGFFSEASAKVTNTYKDDNGNVLSGSPDAKVITLDGISFTVKMGSFVPPQPLPLSSLGGPLPPGFTFGSIGASVDLTVGDSGGGGGNETPEPSAMVL